MDHEPCKSRGDCYHARIGRIGGFQTQATWGKTPEAHEAEARGARNQPHEARARAARNAGFKTMATWGRTPKAHEARVRGSHNQPREAKARGGYNQPREEKARGGRKTQATWGKTPEAHEARVNAAHIGGLKTAEILRQKPNREEQTIAALIMTFYPDVWADIIWQRPLPQNLRGVPDLRHPIKVIGEYDGGGHNVFGDHHADDAAKDVERRAAGYAVIRETDPFVLVAKFAYAVRVAP